MIEFTLAFKDSQWVFTLDEEEDNPGMAKFVAHMLQFSLARKRTLAVKPCLFVFFIFVFADFLMEGCP